jgi:hypothetical protein
MAALAPANIQNRERGRFVVLHFFQLYSRDFLYGASEGFYAAVVLRLNRP